MTEDTRSSDTAAASVLFIEPQSGWARVGIGELWRYRELAFFLAGRDLKVRYKQTVLGVAWAVIQPLATTLLFSVFFGRLAGLEERTGGLPYPLFAFTALLPWQIFARALGESSQSLVNQRAILTKVYFPRLYLPVVPILSALVDFAIALALLLVMLPFFDWQLSSKALLVPAFVALALAASLAVALWLSALNAVYRDVRYALGFLLQLWLFASPIAYPLSIVPERWRLLYSLNPMVGVIEGFRWALLDGPAPGPAFAISIAVVAPLLVSGLFFFRRMEANLVDVI